MVVGAVSTDQNVSMGLMIEYMRYGRIRKLECFGYLPNKVRGCVRAQYEYVRVHMSTYSCTRIIVCSPAGVQQTGAFPARIEDSNSPCSRTYILVHSHQERGSTAICRQSSTTICTCESTCCQMLPWRYPALPGATWHYLVLPGATQLAFDGVAECKISAALSAHRQTQTGVCLFNACSDGAGQPSDRRRSDRNRRNLFCLCTALAVRSQNVGQLWRRVHPWPSSPHHDQGANKKPSAHQLQCYTSPKPGT